LPTFSIINRFLEDTCVIATLAYLISRGSLLPKLFNRKASRWDLLALAMILGFAGGSELVFPGERYPYVPFTLAASFAGFVGGIRLGSMSSAVMLALAAVAILTGTQHFRLSVYCLSVLSATVAGSVAGTMLVNVKTNDKQSARKLVSFLVGACAAGAVGELAHRILLHIFVSGPHASTELDIYSVCSNGFGSLLLGLILWDANERYAASLKQVLTEREIASLRLSQLVELQARLRPHFLFNALAGIAGLCVIDPLRAERAITDLAILLRRFLRTPDDISICLRDELANVRAYLAIEKLRLEHRLNVEEYISEETLSMLVPQFALHVPVENAIQHGIARCEKPGTVAIMARARGGRLTLAVSNTNCDRGNRNSRSLLGEETSNDRPHGLTLLAARLRLAHGPAARLRLFIFPNRRSICVLRLPVEEASRGGSGDEHFTKRI
jgi:hypothetical protein